MYLTHCIPEGRTEGGKTGAYLVLERQELFIVGDLIRMLARELRLLQDMMDTLEGSGPSPTLLSAT